MEKRRRTTCILFGLFIAYLALYQRHRIFNSFRKFWPKTYTGKIICWGPSRQNSFSAEVNNTWGKKCDVLLPINFRLLEKDNKNLEKNLDHAKSLAWKKIILSLKYIYDHYLKDADWLLKVDNKHYVVVGNLRKFLKNYNPYEPHFFGTLVKGSGRSPSAYMSGDAGYVMSKGALIKFIEEALPHENKCLSGRGIENNLGDDIELSTCLTNVGVKYGDSRDENGRLRFLFEPPDVLVYPDYNFKQFVQKLAWNMKPGTDIISDTVISFVSPQSTSMYTVDFLFNKAKRHL